MEIQSQFFLLILDMVTFYDEINDLILFLTMAEEHFVFKFNCD